MLMISVQFLLLFLFILLTYWCRFCMSLLVLYIVYKEIKKTVLSGIFFNTKQKLSQWSKFKQSNNNLNTNYSLTFKFIFSFQFNLKMFILCRTHYSKTKIMHYSWELFQNWTSGITATYIYIAFPIIYVPVA